MLGQGFSHREWAGLITEGIAEAANVREDYARRRSANEARQRTLALSRIVQTDIIPRLMLLDRGDVASTADGYRVVSATAEVTAPQTLQALIAARLDALPVDERRLLQDASVLGKTFTLQSLAAIMGDDVARLEPLLRSLVRREFLSVDADPRSGGLDLLLGADALPGLRWGDLAGVDGRISPDVLRASVRLGAGLQVLATDRRGGRGVRGAGCPDPGGRRPHRRGGAGPGPGTRLTPGAPGPAGAPRPGQPGQPRRRCRTSRARSINPLPTR